MNLSIILPTYNESENIIPLVESLKKNLERYKKEIIIIDDNSPDGTGKLAEELSKKDNEVKCITRKNEKGLASAIMRGIKESSGDILIFMDTDFSHNPDTIPGLLDSLGESDIVFASRYIKGGKFLGANKIQCITSKILNRFIGFILQIPILDSTNGFFVTKRKVFDNLNLNKIFYGYGDYCFRLIYHLKNTNVKMKEIPFTYEKRMHGESKTSILGHGISYLIQVMKLRTGIR